MSVSNVVLQSNLFKVHNYNFTGFLLHEAYNLNMLLSL